MKINNKIKVFVLSLMLILGMVLVVGCSTEAEKVSQNVSQEADNFNVVRRLTVINTRTDKPEFELIGQFSITVDSGDNQLEVVCETGKNEYKKHFIGLNDEVMYVIEDVGGAQVNKYKYEVNFLPESIVPIEITTKK